MPGQNEVLRVLPRHAGAHLCDAAGNARAGGSEGTARLCKPRCATRTLPPLSLIDMLCRKRQNARTAFAVKHKRNRISTRITNGMVA